jgi:iron complex outermembrane recepter protein
VTLTGQGHPDEILTPAWRHKIRATRTALWSDFLISADWRYYGGVKLDTGDTRLLDSKIGAQNYLGRPASVKVYGAATLHAGVNNVFDRGPPLIGAGQLPGIYGNGNTISQAYDAKGRYLFVGITAGF